VFLTFILCQTTRFWRIFLSKTNYNPSIFLHEKHAYHR